MSLKLEDKLNTFKVQDHSFITFCFPSNAQLDVIGELNEWLERMVFIYEDLRWLLSQSVEAFWSQILHDASWHKCINSFLQLAPRYYDMRNIPESCKVALAKVSRLFLLVMKRMSTPDEGKELKFSTSGYADIIYMNYVFDAAKLFDLCGIFYRPEGGVERIVKEIVLNVFKYQPKYHVDLANAIENMLLTLHNMVERLSISQSPSNITQKPVHGREAQDMVLFLYDMAKTIETFIVVYPGASKSYFNSSILPMLITVCENTLPKLIKLIKIKIGKYKYFRNEIEKSFCACIQLSIQYGYIERDSGERNECDLFSVYTIVMDSMAQCPRFLASYCELGTIGNELERISTFADVDASGLQYLKSMVNSTAKESANETVVHQLQELLPAKSGAYIQKCIETCGHDISVIMNNVMEGKIIDEDDNAKKKPQPAKTLSIPTKALIEDNKEHVALLKATLLPDPQYRNDDMMYEDEYDDTYDSQNIAAGDADSADELIYGRKVTIPRILRQSGARSESEEDESDMEAEKEVENQGHKTNSEDAKNNGHPQRGRGRGKGANRGARNTPKDSSGMRRDDSSSNRGRGRSNKRNHRALADKKRSKGMMPF